MTTILYLQPIVNYKGLSNFFSNYDKLNQPTLSCLCGAHGLSSHGTKTKIHNRLFCHICGVHGKDPSTLEGNLPPSCENTLDEPAEHHNTSDPATYVLVSTV